MTKEKGYEVIILGTGPAGLSAAIYTARYGLKTLVIGKEIGGMMNLASAIDNYPGFSGSGIELGKKMAEQAKKSGAEIIERSITSISKNSGFKVQTGKNEYFESPALIFAFGTEKRKLNVAGEDKFLGKGVSYCATCDAPFFRDKIVAVVGGRNSAAHAALLLAKYAKKVFIVYRQETLNCDKNLTEMLEKDKKIEIIYNALPSEIKGNEVVEEIVLSINGKNKTLKCDGIFVEIGSVPISSIAANLSMKLDEEGYVHADNEMKTNISGLFAAGDIVKSSLKQMIVAAGQGAVAAASAYKFLKGKKQRK